MYTLAVSVVELDDLEWVELEEGEERERVGYPSGLGNLEDGELAAIETLHLDVELFVTDDEDDVYWE